MDWVGHLRNRTLFSLLPPRVVARLLCFGRSSCRNESNHRFVRPIGVHDYKNPEARAQSQQHEPIFIPRVLGIAKQEGVVISKNRLRFLEGHAMLSKVDPRLRGVPFDADRHHRSMYVRCMYCARWEWRGQRIALKLRATRPPAQEYWTNSPCPPGHNAPLPLRRSPPASF